MHHRFDAANRVKLLGRQKILSGSEVLGSCAVSDLHGRNMLLCSYLASTALSKDPWGFTCVSCRELVATCLPRDLTRSGIRSGQGVALEVCSRLVSPATYGILDSIPVSGLRPKRSKLLFRERALPDGASLISCHSYLRTRPHLFLVVWWKLGLFRVDPISAPRGLACFQVKRKHRHYTHCVLSARLILKDAPALNDFSRSDGSPLFHRSSFAVRRSPLSFSANSGQLRSDVGSSSCFTTRTTISWWSGLLCCGTPPRRGTTSWRLSRSGCWTGSSATRSESFLLGFPCPVSFPQQL